VSVSDIQFDECLDLWFPVKTVSVEEEESAELHVLLFKSMDPEAVLFSFTFFNLVLSVLFIQGLLSVFGRPMKSVPVRMAAGDILLGKSRRLIQCLDF
jgi:hypothetical protein